MDSLPLDQMISLKALVGSIVYSLLGVVTFIASFVILDKATPGDLWREIIQEKNVAVAVLAGSAAIGLALIISSAIHG
jgi:uncharacterized membrane protein YjfL (UPF0719 family)